jgi:D-3-phosphoglycerate dehydrogenase
MKKVDNFSSKLNLFFFQHTGLKDDVVLVLNQHFNLFFCNENNFNENLNQAHYIFTELNYFIGHAIIEKCPNLKCIITPTTGLNHLDIDLLFEKKIDIISLKGDNDFLANIPSTAEFTFGLILSLLKKIPFAFNDVGLGRWERNSFIGNNLKGKTLGLLGYGRVGKQVARYASAFEMNVLYFDSKEIPISSIASPVSNIEDLFSSSDIVSLHITGTSDNEKIISSSLLNRMKSKSFLVNTSRGLILDEAVLADLIVKGHLSGFAADVLTFEGSGLLFDSPLFQLSKDGYPVIITPHIAGATTESMELTTRYVVHKFLKKYT